MLTRFDRLDTLMVEGAACAPLVGQSTRRRPYRKLERNLITFDSRPIKAFQRLPEGSSGAS